MTRRIVFVFMLLFSTAALSETGWRTPPDTFSGLGQTPCRRTKTEVYKDWLARHPYWHWGVSCITSITGSSYDEVADRLIFSSLQCGGANHTQKFNYWEQCNDPDPLPVTMTDVFRVPPVTELAAAWGAFFMLPMLLWLVSWAFGRVLHFASDDHDDKS